VVFVQVIRSARLKDFLDLYKKCDRITGNLSGLAAILFLSPCFKCFELLIYSVKTFMKSFYNIHSTYL